MNTERPDHDDAEAVPPGGARHPGDASGEGGTESAPEERGRRERGAADGAEPASARGEREEREKHGDPEVGEVRAAHGTDDAPAPRRRSPALIASVAAAVLLVGGGGAWLAGAAGDSGGRTAPGANGDATPPPLALDGHSEGGSPGIAPGEPNPYGATYRADGTLPDGPGSAPVYRAGGQITREQVAALAKALGIDGRPVAEGGSWRIGGRDGSGPGLRVDRQAPGTWTFSRYAPGTDNCKGATCKAPSAGGPAVSEEAAKKAAAPVLKAVGQDDAKLDAGQVTGGGRVVNADPEIGGLPTHGWTTGVVVGATGEVVGGSGRLSKPVKGDTYPVVSAEEALDLMNAAPGAGRRAGTGGCATPVPLEEQGRQEPCGAVTTPPGKGALTVEKAVFGLAAHAVDGRPALVPSWLFEARPEGAKDALTVTYPAVDPEYLAPRDRSGRPSPEPTVPGDGPTGTPATRNVAVEGYTAEGTELTVGFTGGVCAAYGTTVSESADRVTVTVTETQRTDKVCILIAKQYRQTVQLEEPLGDREVVGADGEPIPLLKEGARLPAPSSGAR
ncbi:hypothetical protein [Streptomyces griseomycini]|uniref:Large membrane protein n=1 Tax=Streptomyces griseomycini TaxID=66895 RepID=A0A7W7PQ21_9ACTN|nr:hypothetical protein [Streptomyces griseomycini]MBB4896390.1 hypothetical protein [Streptomyces griseomycini]GGR02722.1 membrane protein [Streptomyces griseomycini]